MELCEECWKNEHDEEDYRKHNIGFIKVNLEPQKEIQKRIVKNRKNCQKMSRILEDWKKIIQQAQIAENKQNEVLKASTANQLEQKSDIVRNLIQNHITDVRKFRETVFNELEELERKQRCIFGDAFDSDYDSFLNRSCSTPVETNFSSRSSAAQRQVLERVLQEELLKFNIGDDADNFAIRSSSTLERNDISMTVSESSRASQIARRAMRRLMQDELLSDSIGGNDNTLSTRPSSPSMLDSTMTSAGNPDLSATAGSSRVEVSEGSSESAVGDNGHVTPAQPNKKVASTLKRGKKRELVRVTQSAIGDEEITCYKAVYNTATKEVICVAGSTITVLRLNGPNGKFEVSKEMKLKPDANNSLWDITLDSNNSLYGLIENKKNRVKRVAVLDIMKNKELIEERKLLDTEGLPDVYWKLCAVGETVAVVVKDYRGDELECNSVTLYRSHIRQQTVQLKISLKRLLLPGQLVLVNENTLLLFTDRTTIAVVSLPSQQTTTPTTSAHTSKLTSNTSQKLQPKSIKYIQLSDMRLIESLAWIPSEESVQSDAAEGYLFALYYGGFSHVYKINLEKDMAEVAEGEERTITPMEGIDRLDNTAIQCSIDISTLFATTERPSGKPMLLNLEYTTP